MASCRCAAALPPGDQSPCRRYGSAESSARHDGRSRTRAADSHARHHTCHRYPASPPQAGSDSWRNICRSSRPSCAPVRAWSAHSPTGSWSAGWQVRHPIRVACRAPNESLDRHAGCRGHRRLHSHSKSPECVPAECRQACALPGWDRAGRQCRRPVARRFPWRAQPAPAAARRHPRSTDHRQTQQLLSCAQPLETKSECRYHRSRRVWPVAFYASLQVGLDTQFPTTSQCFMLLPPTLLAQLHA